MATARPEQQPRTFTFLSCPLVAVVAVVARWLPCLVPGHCHRCQPRGAPLGLASLPDGCWEVGAQLANQGGQHLCTQGPWLCSCPRLLQATPAPPASSPLQEHPQDGAGHPQDPGGFPRPHVASRGPMEHPQAPCGIPRLYMASPGPTERLHDHRYEVSGWCRDGPHPFSGLTWGSLGSCSTSPYLAAPGQATRAAPQQFLPELSAFLSRRKLGQWVGGPGKLAGSKIPLPLEQGARRGKARPALAFLFPSPPSPRCSPRGPWPQEQCLLLCAGCESRPPDRRMLLTESWKWFRQWLGPFRTGRRGQSRENKSDLASCAEAGPLFANGHVLRSSPAWESCKTIAKPGAKHRPHELPCGSPAPRSS